jgi:hypothetical protein
MDDLIILLEQNPESFENWLTSFIEAEKKFNKNDLFQLAERAAYFARKNTEVDLTYTRISIRLYEFLSEIDYNQMLTAVNLRIRAMKYGKKDDFLTNEKIVDLIHKNLSTDISTIEKLADNWQESSLDNMRFLRNIKMWIKILERFELASGEELLQYRSFKDLKKSLP